MTFTWYEQRLFMNSATTLSYPFPELPAGGEMREVAPDTFWVRMPLPFALNHINLWLLRDGEAWAMVDTGFALPEVKAYWEQIFATLKGEISKVIVTHFHPDHVGLASWVQEKYPQAELFITAAEFLTAHLVYHELAGHGTAAMLASFAEHGLDAERLAALAERGNGYKRGVAPLPNHYNRLQHGQKLRIGRYTWEVVDGFGHSPEHAMLYGMELGVLISGDMLLPKISTNISVFAVTPTDDALQRYLRSIGDYAARFPAETLVLPSHGLPFVGIQPRVAELEAHHQERLAQLEEHCEFPQSAAELLTVLFPRTLDTHQTMFAMGEAIAHLNHLQQGGRLHRHNGADGVIRFQRVSH